MSALSAKIPSRPIDKYIRSNHKRGKEKENTRQQEIVKQTTKVAHTEIGQLKKERKKQKQTPRRGNSIFNKSTDGKSQIKCTPIALLSCRMCQRAFQ